MTGGHRIGSGCSPVYTGMDTQNLADLYELPALDWSSVTNRLDAGCDQAPGSGGPDRHTTWPSTSIPTAARTSPGRLARVDGCFWFETARPPQGPQPGPATRGAPSRIATHDFDLVVEGTARS